MKRMKTLTILAALGLIAILLCANPSAAYAACTSPAGAAGEVVYNVDAKIFQYCNDSAWIEMNWSPGSGSGGCNLLSGNFAEGRLIYHGDHRVMTGCAGNVQRVFGPVGGKFGWKQISAGSSHACGIKSDGTLWCWGSNSSGQLGDNTTTQRLVPTAISGGGAWKQVAAGVNSSHSCGIKSDDTLWCWGSNNQGQLGDNSTTQRLIPTAINGGGSWKQVAAGNSHTCAIKSDDSLHCWGFNNNGRLGDNSTTQRLIPTAISGGGVWSSTAMGSQASHSCAISNNKSVLYCWGNNSNGQITATEFSSPYRLTGVSPLCSAPVGKAGTLGYNSDFNVMQYCDGVGWVRIGK